MTNNSIFTKVLALMICFVMLVGTLTACFQETEHNHNVGTTTTTVGGVTTLPTTKPTTTTPTTTEKVEDEPVEEPVDPNEIFSASTDITSDSLIYGTLANDLVIGGVEMGALVPADVKVESGASSLALSVKKVEDEILYDALSNLDVHIDGIALDNTVPMVVKLGAILEAGLGATELKLYHTENGVANLMTRVSDVTEFAIHNQYYYNAETGEVTIYIASFSLITAVKSEADTWDGTVAEGFASGTGTEEDPYIIETAEQLAYFRAQVDGGRTFEAEYVKLAKDIDLANIPFDPIGFGYWKEDKVVDEVDNNTVFMGTFDGGNHTIYNLYENCWELDPDKTNYGTYTYSTAGAGLFASIKNATVKNLAVSGAEIVFECVDMGIVVGYAQGTCHFENIVVTNSKIANYNRYTGGVVGEVSGGPYGIDKTKGYSHTFKNITVDSSVTVSGLWGSFGCGMGGVIGGKWGDATVYMENVVSAPVMDVYNDVVSAYQWYAFRGCGMLIGHTEEPYSDGRTSGNATANFLTCENVNVYYGDWVDYNYYEFENQDNATGQRYPWVRAEEGKYCEAFSNIRYGVPTHTVEGVTTAVSELSPEELEKVATDHVVITFDQLYGADRGMYGTNKHEGVNVSYKSPKTFYIENNVGWKNLTLHYTYEIGEETWTTVPEGVELFESNGVYRVDLPEGAISFTITADGDFTSEAFIVSELTEKETYPVHEHEFNVGNECECGATQTETWEKLTSKTELKVGDFIVFAYENGKMELSSFSTTKTIYGIGTEFNTLPNGTMTFEVVKGFTTGTIAFKNGDKYLYWTSDNSLDMNDTLNANTSWTVSVDENGNATVLNAKDNTRKLQWNATNPRFACYTSAQTAISIYVKTAKISCAECAMQVVDHKDASCDVAGYTLERCSVCGKEERTEYKALEHTPSNDNKYICANGCGEAINLPEAGSTITIADAKLIAETGTNKKYVVTGVITTKPSDSYGATDIKDSNGDTIAITIIKSIDGEIRYDSFKTKPGIDDTIAVLAKIEKDSKGNAQLTDAWMADHVDADENGACDYCGTNFGGTVDPTPDPEEPKETTTRYTFANYPAGTQYAKNEVHVLDDIVTIITNDAHFTSELRLYSSSTNNAYAIIKSKNPIRSIGVNAGNKADTLLIYGSNDEGATWTQVATISVTSTSYKDYSAALNGEYMWLKLDVEGSNQVRLKSMTLTTVDSGSEGGETPETPCEHNNTTETTTATCIKGGVTQVTCLDCGDVISEETVGALGHTTENGTCERCGETIGGSVEPVVGTLATFELGANGSPSHNDGSSKTSYSETVNGYTLSITGGTNMYTGARDAKGNSALKLGASSKAGSFTFTVPDDVTEVVIYVAKYKSNTTKISINGGTTQTLTKNSNDGAYDIITIDTSTNKTVTLSTVSGGYRAMVNTIEFNGYTEQ